MKNNNIIVISGPSGSGKSTLIKQLFKQHDDLKFSVSHTTRKIRKGEQEDINYHYLSKTKFEKMIVNKDFVEWAKVYLNYYGTSWNEIISKSENENILVLDIDIQGARKIKEQFNDAVLVLISPPSLSELKRRLINREKREDKDIKTRLKISLSELKEYEIYDHIIINDKLEDSFEILNSIIITYKSRKKFMSKKLIDITNNWS